MSLIEYTWDGIENPHSAFIEDARRAAGHLRIGMTTWAGMRWKFWVYVKDGLDIVRAGDTVILEDDGTITLRRGDSR